MPSKEINKNIDEAKEKLQSFEDELGFIQDAFRSLGARIESNLTKKLEAAPKAVKDIADSFQKDLTNSISQTAKNLDKISDLNADILAGKNKEKEINKAIESADSRRRTALRKINVLKNLGVKFSKTDIENLMEQYDLELDTLEALKKQNTEKQKERSLTGLITDNLSKGLDKIDQSGTLSGILKGNFKDVVTFARLGEIALLGIVTASVDISKNVATIAKETGMSYENALALQNEFQAIALSSGNVLITSKKLNESFAALSEELGFAAEFGGQTLTTFTVLTKKLGLANDEAASLTTLARLQQEDTELVMENVVATVSAMNKQNKVGIKIKGVLKDVGSTSNAIKLSLGGSVKELSKAATNAALLGTNLEGVDDIASSLLNFEESIAAELEAEMLIGKELNLDKARQLALDNKLGELATEIADQAALTEAFTTGNRLEQEAAAKAIGISRDTLGDMVMQSQLNALGAEKFTEKFGDATYQQLQALSAQEKMNLAMEKFQESLANVGILLTPIIDSFAAGLAAVSEMKGVLIGLGGILAGLASYAASLAVKNLANAVANIWAGGAKMGIPGFVAAGVATATMFALYNKANKMKPADDIAMPGIGAGYGNRILSGPEGSFALNNRDTVVAGTNLGGDNSESKKTNRLLQAILNRPAPKVQMDSIEVGTVAGMSAFPIQ